MQASQTPTLVPLAFAANGTKNTIPENSQISITPGAASLNDGFPPLTFTPIAAGGVPPAGADFNGVLNLITQTIRWSQAGGMFGYNSGFATDPNVGGYPKGALLKNAAGTGIWTSTVDNNTSNPDTGGANWVAGFTAPLVVGTALTSQHAAQLGQIAAPIGAMSNGVVALLSAGNSLTFTADQVIVGSALNGLVYSVPSVSLTINTSTVGANGMNSGAPTASWFVAVYLIYNPLTGAKALLGVNETAATQPPMICAAAGIPAGYTASALIGSYWTNGSGQFSPCTQRDRRIWNNGSSGISGVGAVTLSGFVWPSVPNAAKTVSGAINITNTTASADTCILYSFPTGGPSSRGVNRNGATGGVQAPFADLAINPSFTRASYVTSTQTGTGLTITAISTDYTI